MLSLLKNRQAVSWPYVLDKDSDQAVDLVGWYTGDPFGSRIVYDLSPKKNHLTIFNDGTRSGKIKWVKDQGVGSYVNFTTTDNFENTGIASNTGGPNGFYSFSCWVLAHAFTAYTTGNDPDIAPFFDTNNADPHWALSFLTGPVPAFYVRTGGARTWAAGATTLSTEKWYHLAGVYRGASHDVYLNGVKEGSGTPFDTSGVGWKGTNIGGQAAGSLGGFNGAFTECRVYSRRLSDSEVWKLYDPSTRFQLRYKLGKVKWFLGSSSGGGTSVSRTTSDAATYAESISRVFAGLRTGTDAPTFGESLTRLQSLFRAPTDAPTYLDAATRAASLNKVAADAPTYLDVATRLFVGIRIAADAPIYSDAATRIGAFGRTASDSVTYSESCTRTGSFHPFTVDAATYSDVATRNGSFHKTATDACSYTESIGSIAGKNFTGTDAVSYSESISRQGTFSRAINDIASYLESVTRAASEVRASGDAVTYAEASTRIVATNRSTTEAESYATSVVTIATKMRSGTEALTYSDTATRIAILLRITTDGLTYSEVAIPDLGLIHGPRITDRFDFTMTVTDRDSFPGSVTDYVAFLE